VSAGVSECRPAGDYLDMDEPKDCPSRSERSVPGDDTTPATALQAPDQDALYASVRAEFGAPLARLAAAYEHDPARQQDLLQELHLAVWRSFASFRGQCSLRTWVYRVAHNAAATHVRGERRRGRIGPISLEELDELPGDADVERLADEAARLDKLREVIARLAPLDRNVVLLYLEGLTAGEIGEVVGIARTNVAQKIHRAKKHLRRQLGIDAAKEETR
jgi:RNA polymerase sigma-70 factor, ECF subfamily